MHRILLTACLLTGYGLPACAQISGYLGQRNTLAISVYSFPNSREYLRDAASLTLNTRVELGWERVISRRMSLRPYLGTLQSRLVYDRPLGQGQVKIEARQVGIEMRFFNLIRRGNLAPIGPYQSISFGYVNYRATDLDGRFRPGGAAALGRYGDWVLGLTLGTQRIIHRQLFFHAGLQGAWIMNLFRPALPDWQSEIRDLSVGRLRGHWSLNIMGGIGVFLPSKKTP